MAGHTSRMKGHAVTVLDLLETHPQEPQRDRQLVARCVEACSECACACTICADADLVESDAADMVRCVRLDLDCADVCIATGRIVARQTASEPAILRTTLEACRTACRSCAEECERHADHHEHCRICAQACRNCEEACGALLAALA
jgi:uncharacterized membrane protein